MKFNNLVDAPEQKNEMQPIVSEALSKSVSVNSKELLAALKEIKDLRDELRKEAKCMHHEFVVAIVFNSISYLLLAAAVFMIYITR